MRPTPNINIPVDVTNPGQFFACCGLLELADRLWPGAEGWFQLGKNGESSFQIAAPLAADLRELLTKARALRFDVRNSENEAENIDDEEDNGRLIPIEIDAPVRLVLDWWSDRSLKPWAGSMNERLILRAMLEAIDPDNPDPLNDSKVVFDPIPMPEGAARQRKLKKREPFYFDCRRGCNAHPLDSGFSPDVHHFETVCFPAVEAMCFIGLQRTRPYPSTVPNRSQYTVWTHGLPINIVSPVVCGVVLISGSSTFTFDNFFRTEQRKHKTYSRATRGRRSYAR